MQTTLFNTNNGHQLVARSGSNFSKITHVAFNNVDCTWPKNQHFTFDLPNSNLVKLMSSYDSGIAGLSLNINTELPHLDFYIRVYTGQYFQVAGIFTNQDDANQFMLKREDVALIDTVESKEAPFSLYIIASLKESKQK
jgi:hypothetical protein